MRARRVDLRHQVARVRRRIGRDPHLHTLENELARVIDACGITQVLDVGAHHGQFGRMLRHLGYEGRLDSFEPSADAVAVLRTGADPRWRIHQVAAGLEDGTATLNHFAGDGQLNSLRGPSAFGRDYWELDRVATSEVRVRRLDTLVADLGVRPESTLLKLDAQGLDFDLVRSVPDLVGTLGALLIELPMFGLYEDAASPGTVVDWLLGQGLSLIGAFPVHAHPRPLVPVEFDALFARSRDIG